ncbi:MAG: Uma2 family endonuclease [Isosphaeraceae bacterium]
MATVTPPQAGERLLTAEEFARRPDPGHPEELVKGRVVAMPPPRARHGQVCAQLVFLLRLYLQDRDLGHVLSNDSGVVTERGPDSVRGPDVSYYAYAKLPKGPLPNEYPGVPPDAVFEVLSPHDRWLKVLAKVAEFLEAGVGVVVVLDPERRVVQVFEPNQPVRSLAEGDVLTLPDVLPEFRVALARLFE